MAVAPFAKRTTAAVALIVGIAAGVVFGFARKTTAPTSGVAALVASVSEAVDQDRLDRVWELLDLDTKSMFERAHALLLTEARDLSLRVGDDTHGVDARTIAALEREHGMKLGEILASSPLSMWSNYVERKLGPPTTRARFAQGTVEWFRESPDRAVIRLRLPDGRTQALSLLEREGSWRLVDFQPYSDVDRRLYARMGLQER